MNKLDYVKKGLKLNETDKKVLLAYSNIIIDTVPKPTVQTSTNISTIKV